MQGRNARPMKSASMPSSGWSASMRRRRWSTTTPSAAQRA